MRTRTLWAVLLGAALLAAALATRAGSAWPTAQGTVVRPDAVVTLAALGTGAAVAAWYAATAAVALALRALTGATVLRTLLDRAGAPVLRRAAVAGAYAGLGLALSVSPAAGDPGPGPTDLRITASLDPGPDDPAPTDPPPPSDLRWGAPTAAAAVPSDLRRRGDEPGVADDARVHTVERGECLWSIAEAHLGPGVTDADIADAWPRWYALNRAVIGPDPDLIHPGQALLAPSEETS